MVETGAEVSIGQIEFHVVRLGIGTQRALKMLDGVIVQTVTREQYANASLSAIVVGADLIELRDHLPGFVPFPEPQVSFGEQIKVLRLARVLLDTILQFGNVELSALLRRKLGTVVEVVEKVLIGIRPGRSILRECLKDIQVSLRGRSLMEAPFYHGKFVITVRGIAAYFHISPKKLSGFREFLIVGPQIR